MAENRRTISPPNIRGELIHRFSESRAQVQPTFHPETPWANRAASPSQTHSKAAVHPPAKQSAAAVQLRAGPSKPRSQLASTAPSETHKQTILREPKPAPQHRNNPQYLHAFQIDTPPSADDLLQPHSPTENTADSQEPNRTSHPFPTSPHRESLPAESRIALQSDCTLRSSWPAEHSPPAPQSSQTSPPAIATPRSFPPTQSRSPNPSRVPPADTTKSHTTPSKHHPSKTDALSSIETTESTR